ncbi:TPR_REGION domain-containing protein [Meloidogyne graminicola]|uniref:TPR_REGION domain-containing protein n=1 Tax=Meloidogyne graminicola TaxID=189291 RepID=A0A8S9ZZW1_9BILA|nr:TPR_REGION domain-containing protein [Meloidogyne graminicola]
MCSQRDKEVLNMILNPNLPFKFETEEKEEEEQENYSNLQNYKESEVENIEGVKLAENNELEKALEKFNKAIELCPQNPSIYNNRAQLYRLMENIEQAKIDLNKSLELSKGKGYSAAQAYVQLALIHRLNNEEEYAKNKFEKAAELGSNFAKNQLVAMNPYAAMCNKMLGEIMVKMRQGEN